MIGGLGIHRRGQGLLAGALAALLVGLTPTPAQAAGAFQRSPASGPPGAVISLSSQKPCPPPSQVQAALVDSASHPVATTTIAVQSNGSWSGSLTVPSSAPAGSYAVEAQCASPSSPFAYDPQPFTVTSAATTTTATTTTTRPTSTTSTSRASTTTTAKGATTTTTGGSAVTSSTAANAVTETTVHVKRNPITSDWPQLSADDTAAVQRLIDAGDNAGALAELVTRMKKYCCNFDTMKNGLPGYDPNLRGEGVTERKKGGAVTMGPDAFSSVAWLYSSLKHEMVHSQQWQDPDAAAAAGSAGRERQAYQREIDNAANTGVSADQQRELRDRLGQYR